MHSPRIPPLNRVREELAVALVPAIATSTPSDVLQENLRVFAARAEAAAATLRTVRSLGRVHASLMRAPCATHLTDRELDILRLIGEGKDNVAIARELHFALGTIKLHVREILEKLNSTTRTEAAVQAVRRGLI